MNKKKMNVINTGCDYEIYNDSEIKTFNLLPTKIYTIEFHKMRGFYLKEYDGLDVKEKVYGVHETKINKVMNSFNKFERSLGVILSGDKGIGKSLFSKMLANECLKRNIPVLLVNTYFPNIASFIDSIHQEVMVLFDEFDKSFGEVQAGEGHASPQTELLTLFDGISTGDKRLYVITCNSLQKLNDYLVNRPGRFHYHFRFSYPNEEEIKTYLEDKLSEEYYGEIQSVVMFSKKVDLNYDCLRAIAFELNNGSTFKEAIEDLNIINFNAALPRYNIKFIFDNGMTIKKKNWQYDIDDEDEQYIWLSPDGFDLSDDFIRVSFIPANNEWDNDLLTHAIKEPDIKTEWFEKYIDENEKENAKNIMNARCITVIFDRVYKSMSLNYKV